MKSIVAVILLLISMPSVNYAQTNLKAGDKAPDFKALDQDGKVVSLSSYKGKKLILYFYPKDFTSGCTEQACSLRDNMSDLTKEGYTVLGVSTDDVASHKSFQEKNSINFRLVSDTDKAINKKYGVWVERDRNGVKSYNTLRTTFLINKDGFINKVIETVNTKNHATQILSLATGN